MNTGNASNGQDPYRRHVDARLESLSAYVDGEVSPEERHEVEAWLSRDASTREALTELQDLSATLKSLPRGVSSPDLAGAVLQRLHAYEPPVRGDHKAPSAPDVVLQPRTASIFQWRRRELFAAALGAVASLLVVASLPLATDPSRELSSLESGNSPGGMLVADHTEREAVAWTFGVDNPPVLKSELQRGNEKLQAEDRMVVANSPLPELRGGNGAMELEDDALRESRSNRFSSARASVPAERTLDGNSAKMLSAEIAADSLGVAESDFAISPGAIAEVDKETLEQLEPWEQVQPYLGLISQNTTAVTNFDVVVLDVKQAADQFEVLLLRNGIPVVVEGSQPTTLSKRPDQPVPVAQPTPSLSVEDPSLTALYIEAEEAPLTNALRELVRQRQVLSMKLQPPLEVESVADSAEESPVDGLAAQQNVRADALKLAYGNSLRIVRGRDVLARESDAVSALEDLANVSPDQDPSSPTSPLAGQVSPQFANSSSRQSGIGTGFGGKLAGTSTSPAESENLLSNFGQRLQLPQPEVNWLDEVQRRGSRPYSQGDVSFDRKLTESIDPTTNSLRAMRREFQSAASNTVRVLFVLQPASGVSNLGSTPAETTTPTTSPAAKSPPDR